MKNRKKAGYHSNFDRRAREIKEAANWTCKLCGLYVGPSGVDVVNVKTGVVWTMKLDAMHPFHNPADEDAILWPCCHLCHMAYDNSPEQRKRKRALEQQVWMHRTLINQWILQEGPVKVKKNKRWQLLSTPRTEQIAMF